MAVLAGGRPARPDAGTGSREGICRQSPSNSKGTATSAATLPVGIAEEAQPVRSTVATTPRILSIPSSGEGVAGLERASQGWRGRCAGLERASRRAGEGGKSTFSGSRSWRRAARRGRAPTRDWSPHLTSPVILPLTGGCGVPGAAGRPLPVRCAAAHRDGGCTSVDAARDACTPDRGISGKRCNRGDEADSVARPTRPRLVNGATARRAARVAPSTHRPDGPPGPPEDLRTSGRSSDGGRAAPCAGRPIPWARHWPGVRMGGRFAGAVVPDGRDHLPPRHPCRSPATRDIDGRRGERPQVFTQMFAAQSKVAERRRRRATGLQRPSGSPRPPSRQR